jgi:hypothetical protein
MKTVLESNIAFEDELLERCRAQFPERDAAATVDRMLFQLEWEHRRIQKIVRAMIQEAPHAL